jgi:circadian clock protein KaiC
MTKIAAKERSLRKAPTHIPGLDEILRGGLPRERITVVLGGPGSGKTILALQALVNGARHDREPGIFVAFEESAAQIVGNAEPFGWDLPGLQRRRLFFLDARVGPDLVKAGDFDLESLLSVVGAKARQLGARRIVFDAIDVLLSLLDDPAAERRELFRLQQWLQASGLTAMITAKAQRASPSAGAEFTPLQFMADTVITLNHELRRGVALRNLWVMKYRGSGYSENEVAVMFGRSGMEVAAAERIELEIPAAKTRLSTGVGRLDAMLGGGYFRGSTILLTGAPGTSKSALAGAFAEAACRRGERVLYVSFDESAAEMRRNLLSVGIRFAPHLRSGRLRVHSILADGSGAKEHFTAIRDQIDTHRPDCLVLDSLSALIKGGGQEGAQGVAERLVRLGKARAITVLSTSLIPSPEQEEEASTMRISTIADTWLHLAYVVRAGERNRALTIVKSRGTSHSNQVRELILSADGITLTDVYAADGEVLMGTLRWQKEQADRAEEARAVAEVERRRLEIELRTDELTSRLELLRREVKLKEAEMGLLLKSERTRVGDRAARAAALAQRRGRDPDGGAAR